MQDDERDQGDATAEQPGVPIEDAHPGGAPSEAEAWVVPPPPAPANPDVIPAHPVPATPLSEGTVCPRCGSHLHRAEDEAVWRCENTSCPAKLQRGLEHFASRSARRPRPRHDAVGCRSRAVLGKWWA